MSRGYAPIPDEQCMSRAHFSAVPWSQWLDSLLHFRATRGVCAASSTMLDVPPPVAPAAMTEVARYYYVAHPDETHVSVRLTWDMGGSIGPPVECEAYTQDAVLPVPGHVSAVVAWTDQVWAPVLSGAMARCTRLGYPASPCRGSWAVVAHAAGLPRDRVLVIRARAGLVGGGGWAGTPLRLRGVIAHGLRVD